MPRAYEGTKSNLFAQIWNPYEVTSDWFAQIKDVSFVHVYKD